MNTRNRITEHILITVSISLIALFTLPAAHAAEDTTRIPRSRESSSFLSVYDTGIPPYVSKEWSFPTGFSLVLSGGHQLLIRENKSADGTGDYKFNQFPVSVLLKYCLYKTRSFSQSVGFGLGPHFTHQGPVPILLDDLKVTCGSTYLTEWATRLSKDLNLNLKMKYTQSFETISSHVPSNDFATWLNLNARW